MEAAAGWRSLPLTPQATAARLPLRQQPATPSACSQTARPTKTLLEGGIGLSLLAWRRRVRVRRRQEQLSASRRQQPVKRVAQGHLSVKQLEQLKLEESIARSLQGRGRQWETLAGFPATGSVEVMARVIAKRPMDTVIICPSIGLRENRRQRLKELLPDWRQLHRHSALPRKTGKFLWIVTVEDALTRYCRNVVEPEKRDDVANAIFEEDLGSASRQDAEAIRSKGVCDDMEKYGRILFKHKSKAMPLSLIECLYCKHGNLDYAGVRPEWFVVLDQSHEVIPICQQKCRPAFKEELKGQGHSPHGWRLPLQWKYVKKAFPHKVLCISATPGEEEQRCSSKPHELVDDYRQGLDIIVKPYSGRDAARDMLKRLTPGPWNDYAPMKTIIVVPSEAASRAAGDLQQYLMERMRPDEIEVYDPNDTWHCRVRSLRRFCEDEARVLLSIGDPLGGFDLPNVEQVCVLRAGDFGENDLRQIVGLTCHSHDPAPLMLYHSHCTPPMQAVIECEEQLRQKHNRRQFASLKERRQRGSSVRGWERSAR